MESTIITCPCCGFNKKIPSSSLPKSKVKVACPSCQSSFIWHPQAVDLCDSLVQVSSADNAASLPSENPIVTVKQTHSILSRFSKYIKTRPKILLILFSLILTCTLSAALFYVNKRLIRNKDMVAAKSEYKKGNYVKAVEYYKLYSEKGDASAQRNLGKMYYDGTGVTQNYREAEKWFRKSAEQGYQNAQNILCSMSFGGIGIPENYKEAANWCSKAAERAKEEGRVAYYHFLLGNIYLIGGNGIEKNNKEVIKWMQKPAEQEGEFRVSAQICLGFAYYEEKNFSESKKWFQKAAERGNSVAQYNLGALYFNGDGVAKNYEEAEKWFQKSAAQGYVDANKAISLIDQVKSQRVAKSRYTSPGSGYYSGGSGEYLVTDNYGKETKGYVGSDGYGRDSSGTRSYVDSSGRNFSSYNPSTGKTTIGHIGTDGTITAVDSSGRSYSGIVDSNGNISIQSSTSYSFGGHVNLD